MSKSQKILNAFVWSGLQKIALQLVQFVIGIVLARLLSPEEYGILGILIIFIAISEIFVDGGFSKALIQKTNRTSKDLSTTFVSNTVVGCVAYLVVFLLSFFANDFFETSNLDLYLRVVGISIIINALHAVPGTLLLIDLDFKKIAQVTLIATLVSGGVSIYLAYTGYGIWALIIQVLLRSFLFLGLNYWAARWRPQLVFNKESFYSLFGFGSKLLASGLLIGSFSKLTEFLIGKFLKLKDLGIYTRGIQFADVFYGFFDSTISNVIMPAIAPMRDDQDQLHFFSSKILKLTSVLTIPFFVVLALVAEPLISWLLTDKWLAAAPILQFFCIARSFSLLSVINYNFINALGRSDLVLQQQYWCIPIRVVLVLFALPYTIYHVAAAEMIASLIHLLISMFYGSKVLGLNWMTQIGNYFPILIFASIMALCIHHLLNDYLDGYGSVFLMGFGFFILYGLMAYFLIKKDVYRLLKLFPYFANRLA